MVGVVYLGGVAGGVASAAMFSRGSRRRREREADPDLGRPCRACRDTCPGYLEHPWRKVCRPCGCPRGEHSGGQLPPALQGCLARLLPEFRTPTSASSEDSGFGNEEFSWAPPGLSAEQVSRYFSALPAPQVPRLQSAGQRHRVSELLRQLPPHDLEPQFCHDLDEIERREFKLFAQRRKRENLGQGSVRTLPLTSAGAVCQQCGSSIPRGSLAVFAARAGLGLCWHPQCFRCQQCHQLLADLVYFCPSGDSGGQRGQQGQQGQQGGQRGQRGQRVLCGRHHGDSVRHRCAGCDELIFGTRWLTAGGHHWHLRHLRCVECEEPLEPSDTCGTKPRCESCRRRGAHLCDTCGDTIGPDVPHVAHRGQHWHPLPGCFRCSLCCRPLLGKPFLPLGGQIFCSPRCAQSPPEPRGDSHSHRDRDRDRDRSSWGGAPPAGFRRGFPHRHSMPELGVTQRPSPTAVPSPQPAPPPPAPPPRPSPPRTPRRGRGRARWSSSSSSSSSSEGEGLFLGQPIPLPPQLRPPAATQPRPPPQPRPPRQPRPPSRGCRLA